MHMFIKALYSMVLGNVTYLVPCDVWTLDKAV